MGEESKTRDDIRCPKTGELIPLPFGLAKWSDDLYLAYCQTCGVNHEFRPQQVTA